MKFAVTVEPSERVVIVDEQVSSTAIPPLKLTFALELSVVSDLKNWLESILSKVAALPPSAEVM